MRSYLQSASRAAALFLALGVSVSAASQQEGPTTPAPTAQASPESAALSASPQAASTPPATATAAKSEPHAKGAQVVVPTGTHIPLVLHNGISTRTAKPGDPVYFETLFPILIDGKVAIPAGSYISGELTEAKRPGRAPASGH